jgi:hypothetical protein
MAASRAPVHHPQPTREGRNTIRCKVRYSWNATDIVKTSSPTSLPEPNVKPDNKSDHATSSSMMTRGGMQRLCRYADTTFASYTSRNPSRNRTHAGRTSMFTKSIIHMTGKHPYTSIVLASRCQHIQQYSTVPVYTKLTAWQVGSHPTHTAHTHTLAALTSGNTTGQYFTILGNLTPRSSLTYDQLILAVFHTVQSTTEMTMIFIAVVVRRPELQASFTSMF